MKTNYKTEAAYVAALIKAELKHKFPETKFSIKSETFSGGDAVQVNYEGTLDGPKVSQIESITNKYLAGKFDGMTDMYENTNHGTGPKVKYINVSCDINNIMESLKNDFMTYYQVTEEEYLNKNKTLKNGMWLSQLEYSYAYKFVR